MLSRHIWTKFVDFSKCRAQMRVLIKASVTSQFRYSLLILILHSWTINQMINNSMRWSKRQNFLLYITAFFCSVTICQRILKVFLLKWSKPTHYHPQIQCVTCANLGVFHTKCKKKKRDLQETMRNKTKKRGRYGANTVSHISAKILQFVLKLNKEVSRTNQFSENKKNCILENCACHIWNMHFP